MRHLRIKNTHPSAAVLQQDIYVVFILKVLVEVNDVLVVKRFV